ncbi:centromere-associated protein E isoform X2 [Procambarus clarkii]|uniref:centromere-associated protein E isoform X2 n=1 Tax=Procambarus clarkii TaxID=6728 RepID=UPI001E677F0E|nr:centromere-associated protein E-like isoform X2 [Procambarus clarkii]
MSDNILVAVRLRPLISREETASAALHWQIGPENTLSQIDPSSKKLLSAPYKFDRVYGVEYDNEDVYIEVAEPIVESALAGFNGTIFAYGQTSSGKTFTMMGNKDSPGIIPLAIQNIFRSIENTPDREYLIRVSYMEIYNENITDLLASRDQRLKSLAVREDVSGAVFVADLKEECVNSEEKLLALMRKGDKNRHVGMTNMNERSSRSHSIFRLILESRERGEGDSSETVVTVSHLNLVDLAGSENASQSGATGERLKEGGFINRSLFMLGRVISQLSEGEQFVNFRDSKLTRILQLSLGGNSKTAIFCTITPAAVEQTHSTLRFASRAKSIKNQPIVNEVLSDAALLKRYATEIKNLKYSLERERQTDKAQEVEQVREKLDEQERKNQELLAKVNELKTKLVVSSHPRESSKSSNAKKKSRRETWAAPAMFRAMRASMGIVHEEPINVDYKFLAPVIPPWVEQSKLSDSPCSESSLSMMECSVVSDGFGKGETTINMELAEQSKLGVLDNSFSPPCSMVVKRRRRVQFEISPQQHEGFCDAECQTEESLHPLTGYLRLSHPSTPMGKSESISHAQKMVPPGTPEHIRKAIIEELQQKVITQQEWISEYEVEINELQEFQRREIELLQESFSAKFPGGSVDKTMELQRKEIMSLKHSLRDAESLLLDANRERSQNSQEMLTLQEEMRKIKEENLRCSSFEEELLKLREEEKRLKKAIASKDDRLKQLENERQDFDMMMELALQKQKRKENDLRKSLDDAWKEIAAYEGSTKEDMKRRSEPVSLLKDKGTKLRDSIQLPEEAEQKIKNLEQQLKEAHYKQETKQKEIAEQNLKLQQMSVLVKRMAEIESQVSCVESLKSKLTKTQDELENLTRENMDLQDLCNCLQQEGDVGQLQALQEEVQYLRDKLEEADVGKSTTVLRIPHINVGKGDITLSSWEISRKLSETLQVLEESIVTPSSPIRGSISSLDEPFLQAQELEVIKQQLLGLQELILAQENYVLQKQQELKDLDAKTTFERLYHPQVIAEVEEEVNVWKLQESFCSEYIIYFWSSHYNCNQWGRPRSGAADVMLHTDTTASEEAAQKMDYKGNGCDCKYTICKSAFAEENAAVLSFGQEPHCVQTSDALFSSTELDALKQVQQLKCQLELVNTENKALHKQVNKLQENLNFKGYVPKCHACNESVYETPQQSTAPQSLADELRQSLFNETFETSILNLVPDASMSETQQISLEHMKENLVISEQGETVRKESQSIVEKSQNVVDLEKELQSAKKEKTALELEIERLKKLNDTSILEEEIHSLRWQVNSLSEVKAELEEELKLYQEELEKMMEKETIQLKDGKKIDDLSPDETKWASLEKEKLKGNDDICKPKVHIDNETKAESLYCKEDIEQMQSKLQESDKLIASLEKEKEEYIETLEVMKEKLQSKSKEFDEARETASCFKSKVEILNRLTKELEDAKVITAAIKGELGNEVQSAIREDEIEMTDMLRDLREVILTMKSAKVLFADKLKEAEIKIASYEEREKNYKLEKCSFSEELREKEKELECVKEKLVLLQDEGEQQLKNFEEKLTNVIAEKDSELEMVITNFIAKEEAFESREIELKTIAEKSEELKHVLYNKDIEIQNLGKMCADLQNMVKDLEANVSKKAIMFSQIEEKYSELQKEFDLLKIVCDNKILELNKSVTSYEEQLNKTKEDLSKSHEENQKLLLDAECASKTGATITLAEGSGQVIINQKLDELEHLKDEYAIKIKECDQLRNTVDNLKIIVSKKEDELKIISLSRNEEVCSYTHNLNKKDEEINNLQNILKTKNEEVFSLNALTESKDHKLRRLESDLKDVKQTLDDNERALQESISSKEREMSSRMQERDEEIERFKKLYEEVCSDRRCMSDAIKSHGEEAQQLTRECNGLKLKLVNLENDYKNITDILKTKEAKIMEKEGVISLMKLECQKLQEDISIFKSKEKCLIDEQESRNEEKEKVVGIIEKYETELSEKDEEICKLRTVVESKASKLGEMEETVMSLEKTNKEMAEKCSNTEAVQKKCIILEEELLKCKSVSSELASLAEKLVSTEDKLEAVQASLNAKIEEYEATVAKHASEKKELNLRLLETEENYKTVKDELERVEIQLQDNIMTDYRNIKLSLECTKNEFSQRNSYLEMEKAKLEEELSSCKSHEEEMNAQIESNNGQIEKLIRLVEKYETEMSEKEEQMQRQSIKYEAEATEKEAQVQKLLETIETKLLMISELEETVRSLANKNDIMIQKCYEMEDLDKKCISLSEEIMTIKNVQSQFEIVSKELAAAESKNQALQEDLESKINKYNKEIANCILEKEELDNQLIQTKKELGIIKARLLKCEEDLEEKTVALRLKEEENCKLDAELDDMVNYYKKDSLMKAEMCEELSLKYKKVETELSETKLMLKKSFQGDQSSVSQVTINKTLGGNTELHNTIESLEKRLLSTQEELERKEKECVALNVEMDEIVKHFKQEGKYLGEEYDKVAEKLKKTEDELLATKANFLELSKHEVALVGGTSIALCSTKTPTIEWGNSSQDKNILDEELTSQKMENLKLKKQIKMYKENLNDLEKNREILQAELKERTDAFASVHERLRNQDKLRLLQQEEREKLEKKLVEYHSRLEAVRLSAGSGMRSLEKIDELLQKIEIMDHELAEANKKYEDLTKEYSQCKVEYSRLFEKHEELKVHTAKKEMLLEERIDSEEKLVQVSKQFDIEINCSSSEPSDSILNGRKKSKTFAIERERDALREMCEEFNEKIKTLESTLDSLRRSQGTVSTVEEFQRELSWMREKMEAAEKERALVNSNYDSLERDFEALQREMEGIQDKVKEQDLAVKSEELQRKYEELKEENKLLRQATKTKVADASVDGGDNDNLQEQLAAAERVNNELRFRLRALNAPAEKVAQNLREELNHANQKVTQLKKELRRIQNTQCMDSTICQMKPSASHHDKDAVEPQSNIKPEFDYASGSGVVLEIQVLNLQNKVYHLEKEKKAAVNECKTMEEHVDHYKNKAQEWKNNAMIERKVGEKVKKELELLNAETEQCKTKLEEKQNFIERLQFELGHQRETIIKMEKEKQEKSQKLKADSSQTGISSQRHLSLPAPIKETGADKEEDKKTARSRSTYQLGAHNAPLPTQTCIERLPGVKSSKSTQKNPAEKVHMWQSLNKENQDYSKFFSGTSKKPDEDCKTQ